MTGAATVNVGEVIERARLDPVRVLCVALCALVALSDGFDLQIIGLAAPPSPRRCTSRWTPWAPCSPSLSPGWPSVAS